MAQTALKKLPGVLAFRRRHVQTDALFFNEINGGFEENPLYVVRHGIRGTQNVAGDTEKVREVSNIQQTDSAKSDRAADAVVVTFGIRMLNLAEGIEACVATDDALANQLLSSHSEFVERAKKSRGIEEVANRYARNIANGRWLWRNRTIAAGIEITVSPADEPDQEFVFDALAVPMNQFSDYSDDEKAIGAMLAAGMRGESLAGINVRARLTFGIDGVVEVHPSENYIENKPKGFARSLYRVGQADRVRRDQPVEFRRMGQAALRDQKVYNAIRTIDTWYPDFDSIGVPIAVEPMGASLSHQKFFRPKKYTSFDLFKRLNDIDPDSPDGMYCIAALDRAGVYSESDKKNAKAAEKKAAPAEVQ